MNIAIVGCGYVAEFYRKTLANYPELKLIGAYDRNAENLNAFSQLWPTRNYETLQELLDDASVEMVLNLTNPRSHFEVTQRCLEAGKHVYSEKPLAMDVVGATELVTLAERMNVSLAVAPCSVLGETAQTIWKALNENAIGRVRLVYANFDDGMIAPTLRPWTWRNAAGVAWPAKDEFEVGCTYEHAGYVLTWLAAYFGPARRVTSFASVQLPEKGISVDHMAPDFSVGCIEYDNGIVARTTCSLVAPQDKSLMIIGDDGIISTQNVRDDMSPVYVTKTAHEGVNGAAKRLASFFQHRIKTTKLGFISLHRRRLPFARKPPGRFVSKVKPVDFCRGPAELLASIREKRVCRLSGELGLHVTELVHALQYPDAVAQPREISSGFAPIDPLF
jgi:predicted dehydrogenase